MKERRDNQALSWVYLTSHSSYRPKAVTTRLRTAISTRKSLLVVRRVKTIQRREGDCKVRKIETIQVFVLGH